MSSESFLVIAETRADHLRRLSQHERALEWVTASLSEVESEIPDLELAMAVYRRLNPNAAGGAAAFLDTAGVRADHLRQLSAHMRALNWVNAPLNDVEAEIPDLEKAMSVYRRLMPEESGEVVASGTGSRGRGAKSHDAESPAEPPSFKEYALQHADSRGDGEEKPDGPPNGASSSR